MSSVWFPSRGRVDRTRPPTAAERPATSNCAVSGDFVRACHPRRTPTSELYGTKTSQNCELERGKFSWTVYQFNPHSKALVRAGPEWPRAQKSRNRHYTPIRHII